jgi:hypothetical protein
VPKIKVIDRMSGKTWDADVDTEKLCMSTVWSSVFGLSQKCFPMTPDRFGQVMRLVKPGFGSVYVEALVLPDTVRFFVADLVIISPRGVDITELFYDLRLGEMGITYGNTFMPLRINWENAKCLDRTCVIFGALVRDADTLRHVPIIYEKEYLEWLRAMLAKRPAETWEVIMQRLQIYESTLNRLLEELSKLADRSAYELAISVINQARNLMSQIQALTQQPRPAVSNRFGYVGIKFFIPWRIYRLCV